MNQELPKVLMMPDYRQDNPYQSLLVEKMRSQSPDLIYNIIFSSDYRRILPLFRAVKDNSATVLHLHWLTPYLKGETWLTRLLYSLKLVIDLWLTRLTGIKLIWTIHNHLSHNAQFPKLELWLRKALVKLANEIIIHNYSSVEYLQKSGQKNYQKNSKLTIIPHGHYRDIYPPAISQREARKKLNLAPGGYLYLNLGMIRPYKGIENLLQVWQDNQVAFQSHTLLIAGKPINELYKTKILTLSSNANRAIFQPNFIPSAQMHLYFSAADVVVLPFTNILTSGSLILAMSYHKPIIAPRQGGIVETLKNADSLLYDSEDLQGLAKALKASTEIDLNELSNQVKLACNHLNWDKIAQQTALLYS